MGIDIPCCFLWKAPVLLNKCGPLCLYLAPAVGAALHLLITTQSRVSVLAHSSDSSPVKSLITLSVNRAYSACTTESLIFAHVPSGGAPATNRHNPNSINLGFLDPRLRGLNAYCISGEFLLLVVNPALQPLP